MSSFRRPARPSPFVSGLTFLTLLLTAGLHAEGAAARGCKFVSHLRGDALVPPVETSAQGQLQLVLAEDGETLAYRLTGGGLVNVVAVRLHSGGSTVNGPAVATLLGPLPVLGGPARNPIAQGVLDATALEGPLAGQPLSALVDLLRAGEIHAIVPTDDGTDDLVEEPGGYPDGEIRGQLRRIGRDCGSGDLAWFETCGDPVCSGWVAKPGIPPCTDEMVGLTCDAPDAACDPIDDCNRVLVCTDEGFGPCPISTRAAKTDINYLDSEDLERLRLQLLSVRLAEWRYRAGDAPGTERLGFIIEDLPIGSPAVEQERNRANLYGYTSLAVAAIQQQDRELRALRARLRELEVLVDDCTRLAR